MARYSLFVLKVP